MIEIYCNADKASLVIDKDRSTIKYCPSCELMWLLTKVRSIFVVFGIDASIILQQHLIHVLF